jgi:hypothetical protein
MVENASLRKCLETIIYKGELRFFYTSSLPSVLHTTPTCLATLFTSSLALRAYSELYMAILHITYPRHFYV